MVMPGRENLQENALQGDRMRVDGFDDLPGPWKNHYAAVIMKDGGDTATFESAAGMDKWWFGMYGGRGAGQTFLVKTLLAKLRIGVTKGEVSAQACLNYAEALVADDDDLEIARLGGLIPIKAKTDIDSLLATAGITVHSIRTQKDARHSRCSLQPAAEC
jgi:hypothetical protein